MGPQPTALIREAISRNGPVGFDEFMRLALYSPAGYYAATVPGAGSDYRTAPSLSPWFGRLLAGALEEMWVALGRPEDFRVAEVGAGGGDLALGVFGRTGGLAADLGDAPAGPMAGASPDAGGSRPAGPGAVDLRKTPDPEFLPALRWTFVEPLEQIRELQAGRLSALQAPLEWAPSLENLEPAPGVIVANEVLDNFPVKVYDVCEDGAVEVLVGMQDDRFVEVPGRRDDAGHPSPVAASQAGDPLLHLEPGDRFEVCPELGAWVQGASAALSRGFLVVVDYGDHEPDIWTAHPAGTVVTYRQEQLGTDPFSSIGQADITHQVNFSALERAALAAGFRGITTCSQRQWLLKLGLGEVVDALRDRQKQLEDSGKAADAFTAVAERSRVAALGARGGMGDFLVLSAAKT